MSLGPQNLKATVNVMLTEATERESPFSLEISYHYGIMYFISETSVNVTLKNVCVKVDLKVTMMFLYTAGLHNTQCILLKLL